MAAALGSQVRDVVEGLRCTRDAHTLLRSLKQWSNSLQSSTGPQFLDEYVRQSPEFSELQGIWDAQLKARARIAPSHVYEYAPRGSLSHRLRVHLGRNTLLVTGQRHSTPPRPVPPRRFRMSRCTPRYCSRWGCRRTAPHSRVTPNCNTE